MSTPRYVVVVHHGERGSSFTVVDSSQPESEQPCIIEGWHTATEPNAKRLAEEYCARRNWNPLQETGSFLYKCRLCGELDTSLKGGGPALNAMLELLIKGEFRRGHSASMVGQHRCKSGNMGVTDFVGMGPMGD